MSDLYSELLVKKERTAKDRLVKGGIIALIVLLVLDENTAKDGTLKNMDGFYSNWQIDGITVKDAIDFVKKKSAFTVQSVHDGNYI